MATEDYGPDDNVTPERVLRNKDRGVLNSWSAIQHPVDTVAATSAVFDGASSQKQTMTVSTNSTLSFVNTPPAGTAFRVEVEITSSAILSLDAANDDASNPFVQPSGATRRMLLSFEVLSTGVPLFTGMADAGA